MVPRPAAEVAAPAVFGNLFKMHILGSHPGSTKLETLRVGPALHVLTSLPGDSDTD